MNVRVEFPGHGEFWLLTKDESDAVTEGPLAPLDHCDDEGHLTLEAGLFGDSYAHLTRDGRILRYRELIGHRDDLRVQRMHR